MTDISDGRYVPPLSVKRSPGSLLLSTVARLTAVHVATAGPISTENVQSSISETIQKMRIGMNNERALQVLRAQQASMRAVIEDEEVSACSVFYTLMDSSRALCRFKEELSILSLSESQGRDRIISDQLQFASWARGAEVEWREAANQVASERISREREAYEEQERLRSAEANRLAALEAMAREQECAEQQRVERLRELREQEQLLALRVAHQREEDERQRKMQEQQRQLDEMRRIEQEEEARWQRYETLRSEEEALRRRLEDFENAKKMEERRAQEEADARYAQLLQQQMEFDDHLANEQEQLRRRIETEERKKQEARDYEHAKLLAEEEETRYKIAQATAEREAAEKERQRSVESMIQSAKQEEELIRLRQLQRAMSQGRPPNESHSDPYVNYYQSSGV